MKNFLINNFKIWNYNNKSGKKFGMNAWHEILSLNGLFCKFKIANKVGKYSTISTNNFD